MKLSKEKTVADYVTENIKTAHVFKKYGIDFCCGGGVSIEKVCKKMNVDQKVLEKELIEVDVVNDIIEDYDKWDLVFLMIYIENVHHSYVRESLPIISQYANKVAKVHGHHYAEVVKINDLFHEVADELLLHLQKEEQVLFPYIKKLVDSNGKETIASNFGTVQNPIMMLENEHENAGNIFKKIAKLTNNYIPPKEACNTFKALYNKLEEFEQDLHKHIHLENNILHPKAIKLEKAS